MRKFFVAMVASFATIVATGSVTNAAFIANVSTGSLAGPADPNYTVGSGASFIGPAQVLTSLPSTPPFAYAPNTATSRWVWETTTGGSSTPGFPVTRTFRTTFNLTGFSGVTISGNWGTDNIGVGIFLNGVAVTGTGTTINPVGGNGFSTLTAFNITGNFAAGVNNLDFVVQDQSVTGGFRVDGSVNGTPQGPLPPVATPLPATALMAVVGFPLLGLAGAARRRLFA